jgi:DNA-directed RNA polymerase specialized sigma24 family protein
MTRAEVAAATGLSETQVKGHLQYALSLLRKAYSEAEIDEAAG